MFGIKNKDLIMVGLIVGISLFFIGAMINNVFPSNSEDLIGYKISSFTKMIGIGFLISSMIIGGIIVEDIDKNQRMLLFLFGLILLLIYSFGGTQLNWDMTSQLTESVSENEAAYSSRPQGYGTPGFEFLYPIIAIICIFIVKKIKKFKN